MFKVGVVFGNFIIIVDVEVKVEFIFIIFVNFVVLIFFFGVVEFVIDFDELEVKCFCI